MENEKTIYRDFSHGVSTKIPRGYSFSFLVVSDILFFCLVISLFACKCPGPAFNAFGECLGMAFQSLSSESAENIGYVIPTVRISKALADDEPFFLHGGGCSFFFDGEMCLEFSISFWEDT